MTQCLSRRVFKPAECRLIKDIQRIGKDHGFGSDHFVDGSDAGRLRNARTVDSSGLRRCVILEFRKSG